MRVQIRRYRGQRLCTRCTGRADVFFDGGSPCDGFGMVGGGETCTVDAEPDASGFCGGDGYDTAGRVTSVSTAIPGITGSLVTGYVLDPAGNRTQLTWPDGYYVTYAYDALNRMLTAKESGSVTLATYAYDALSRRTNLAYPHGAAVAYSYSAAGDLATLNHSITGSGTVPQYTLGYNPTHQLASEASSQSSYVWQPAAAGTDNYATVNTLNQYPSWTPQGSSSQSFTYDGNGNLTGGTIGTAAWTFAYDPENRLIKANKTGIAATYAYDPLGRRNGKFGTGVTTTYFVDDGTDEIAEYNSAGALNGRYIPGPAINQPIGIVAASGTRRFFQADHHGSTVALVDNAGDEAEGPYLYDSYGDCFLGTTPCASITGPTAVYKFVGMRLDAETGLYYDRARFYSSSLGRFLQTDPVGYAADLNLYTYVRNDPTDRTDPSGMVDDVTGGNPAVQKQENDPNTRRAEQTTAAVAAPVMVGVGVAVMAGPVTVVGTVAISGGVGGSVAGAHSAANGNSPGQVAVDSAKGTATSTATAIGGKIGGIAGGAGTVSGEMTTAYWGTKAVGGSDTEAGVSAVVSGFAGALGLLVSPSTSSEAAAITTQVIKSYVKSEGKTDTKGAICTTGGKGGCH